MGALGSDAAIETADLVIMSDAPSKICEAAERAGKVRMIVSQNIVFALGIKLIVAGMGIAGIATMWEAVFADMGVALLAIFNAMRALR
jgi:Cd2+/Zn2+-exporting ATPase